MSVHVSEKKQDHIREKNFKDAYGIDAKIFVTNFNDEKWNWDKVVLNFIDSLGKNYGLIEHFHAGDDNSTRVVIFEYADKAGNMKEEPFVTCLGAEQAMVELMRKRQRGEDF